MRGRIRTRPAALSEWVRPSLPSVLSFVGGVAGSHDLLYFPQPRGRAAAAGHILVFLTLSRRDRACRATEQSAILARAREAEGHARRR